MRYEIKPSNFMEVLGNAIANKEECSYSGISDGEVVLKGKNTINGDYCRKHNIRVENTYNEGGCIIDFEGDIEFGVFKYNGFEIPELIMKKLHEYLKEKGLNVVLDNNDILVDGYKCGSCSSVNVGDRLIYTGCHISMSVNLEHIKNICTKEMHKVPKGLSEYGITSLEMYNYVNMILNDIK